MVCVAIQTGLRVSELTATLNAYVELGTGAGSLDEVSGSLALPAHRAPVTSLP